MTVPETIRAPVIRTRWFLRDLFMWVVFPPADLLILLQAIVVVVGTSLGLFAIFGEVWYVPLVLIGADVLTAAVTLLRVKNLPPRA